MRLNEEGLKNRQEWESKGYSLPRDERDLVAERTMNVPEWLHCGAGNIFRAFQAYVVQNLLDVGVLDTGLVVAEGYDSESIV